MIGVYFSGTGNSKYCVEKFLNEYNSSSRIFSIEEENVVQSIQEASSIVIGYPVQYSNIPKILRDFIDANKGIWNEKKIFIIATMGLFSGDGAGMLGRLLQRYGAVVVGGIHLKMPDSICDEKVLKRSLRDNMDLIKNADIKINKAVYSLKENKPTQEGIGFIYHLAGLFGQRLFFYNKTRTYLSKLKINHSKCIGCGKCVKLCPMKNIRMDNNLAFSGAQCSMCYRCINKCPTQAITLLGKKVIEQGCIEKYL